MLYFDHNATHPLSDTAREVWLRATRDFPGNPSSPHRLGSRAEAALNEAREKLAHWLGCDAAEIVWTSGATEANNAALHHAARSSEGAAWISAIEHPCAREATRHHFKGRARTIPVTAAGVVELDWLRERLPRERPALVGIMAANNETGVLQPWREALALCHAAGVAFFCDAAQWIGKLPAAGLGGCDLLSGCAHKFGGPGGVGFLKVPRNFQPQILGGPQEHGRRAGTENVAAVLAMVAVLEERKSSLQTGAAEKFASNRVAFEAELRRRLPGAEIVGAPSARLWNTVSVVMPETPDCRQRWVVKLDKLGFAVSTGSACASGREEVSHVLTAMGRTSSEASRVLRFSGGWETQPADWDSLLAGLERAHAELTRG